MLNGSDIATVSVKNETKVEARSVPIGTDIKPTNHSRSNPTKRDHSRAYNILKKKHNDTLTSSINLDNTNQAKESYTAVSTPTGSDDRLVISMKTMPGRIAHIQPTLDSLLFHQTSVFDQFYLALPRQPLHNPDYVIPEFLKKYAEEGLITLLRPDYDYGALDKILHSIQTEEQHFQQQSTLQAHQYRILYLDDDMIYAPMFVEILANKSQSYPDSVVALSGAKLRSRFRQIGHSSPEKDRHPFIYYKLGGVDSFGDPLVDLTQGFMGVLVRLSFFDVPEFVRMAGNKSVPDGVRRSDDYVICGYLEKRNIPRRLVDGGLVPQSHQVSSKIGNLGKTMNRNAMTAAYYLQTNWGIWQSYQFEPYLDLPKDTRDLMDCEARHAQYCPPKVKKNGRIQYSLVTEMLDDLLNVTADTKSGK
ncbi:expressed unknown protein [Seminavis robusta]|uniref:Uncharacterized protein n=1 Tax=Seminavis robusta TaxID=568900 RepID=A0A9N8DH92_9STRA|nr:expressed unknown protein [Seminavis robusta]|eukprot:Sro88_g046310.1 n/a (418) ;mRNA; r:13083-14336